MARASSIGGIPLYRPTIRRKNMNSVLSCMVSDSIGPGPVGRELAHTAAALLGCAGGLALSSYARAIESALDALELREGDAVVLSPLIPRLYLKLLQARKVELVFTDVNPEAGTMLSEGIEKALSRNPKAVILHYALGALPDIARIAELGLPLLEDLSEGLGGTWGERRCGSYGELCVLNLSSPGIITAGGGALVLARQPRVLKGLQAWLEEHEEEILLPDLNAALGLSQLMQMEGFLKKRSELAEIYARSLEASRHRPLYMEEGRHPAFSAYPVIVKDSLKAIRQYAAKYNIETRSAFAQSAIAQLEGSYPGAQSLLWRCLLFPLYPHLKRKDVELISRVLSTLP